MAVGGLTHLDERGHARMVDVTGKPETRRRAVARCWVEWECGPAGAGLEEGVLAEARLAGVAAAKATSALVPLCHPLPLEQVQVEFDAAPGVVCVTAETVVVARTGVEMEALTACAVAALTLIGALSPQRARLRGLALWHKSGGRSGTYERSGAAT
jgi:cyclic pyranopterin phosphate synthase